MTAPTIEAFLQKLSAAAASESFSGTASNAKRAVALGFTSSANSSYAEFVEAFHARHPLAEGYRERYPACSFLPWDAFHKLRRALKLSFDLPQHYVGAVPEHALTWMEVFELLPEDRLESRRYVERPEPQFRPDMRALLQLLEAEFDPRVDNLYPRAVRELEPAMVEVRESFFVLAPPEVFNQDKDWIQRTRELLQPVRPNFAKPVNDPLVVRVVAGGVLVVAAWGDEAEALNVAAAALQEGIPLG
jgi:hypothetical protein